MEFWLILALIGLCTWSAWIDVIWIGAVTVVIYLAIMWFDNGLDHLAFLGDPVNLGALLVLSLAIGTCWSVFKWYKWTRSEEVQDRLKSGIKSFKEDGAHGAFQDSVFFPHDIRAKANIERISTWVIFWPFSMIVYFLEDFLAEIARWIYERMAKVYARITDGAVAQATEASEDDPKT